MAFNDNLNINRQTISRINTSITVSTGVGEIQGFERFVVGIAYDEAYDKQFGSTLGTLRPNRIGMGVITASGSLTVTDEGMQELNNLAFATGQTSMAYLGQLSQVNILIEYAEMNDNKIITHRLEDVHFTSNPGGVNNSDVIYDREVGMVIGKVDYNFTL